MNNYLLFMVLLFQYGVSYLLNRKKITPSSILILTMIVPASLLLLMNGFFCYQVSLETIEVVILLILFFQTGEFLLLSRSNKIVCHNCVPKLFVVNNHYAIFIFVFQVLNLYLAYKYIMQVGAYYGTSGFLSSFAANRLNVAKIQIDGYSGITPSYSNYLVSQMSHALEIISIHVIFVNKVKFAQKSNKWLKLSLAPFFISLLLDSGRATLVPVIVHVIYLLAFLFGTGFFEFCKKNLKRILIVTALVLTFFIVSGSVRDRKNIKNDEIEWINPVDQIATYISSPLIGFDIYVNSGMPTYPYLGYHLFKVYYDLQKKMGANFPVFQLHEDKFYLKNIESNVYTGFSYWIKDFSLLGACFYALILGMIFSLIDILKRKSRIHYSNIIVIYLFSVMFYALIMVFYNDQFRFVLSIDMLIKIFFILIAQKFLVRRYVLSC